MQVSVESRPPEQAAVDLLALPLAALDPQHWRLPGRFAALDRGLGGRISALIGTGDFRGKQGESLLLYPGDGTPAQRLLLVGLGAEKDADAGTLRAAAGIAVGEAAKRRARSAAIVLPSLRRLRTVDMAQALAEGAVLGGYRFDRYQAPREDAPMPPRRVTLLGDRGVDLRGARAGVRTGTILADSQNLARQLSNEPPNVLPPAALARAAQRVAREVGLACRVLDLPELKRHKMGGILAVGGGSTHPPRLVVLQHNAPSRARGQKGKRRARPPTVCVVGKGVTFDSGGLSLKPAASMVTMKHDMSGAAAVVGILRACALLRLPLHVVGVIGSAENLPSDTAYRPDDIITTMSGQNVEVVNTDAEGRLVLADSLHFARTRFEPDALLDLATLTGACSVALGRWASGVIGTHERLVEALRRAGEASGERVWPLPLWPEHREFMRSEIADVKQTGGRDAGTITAAAFLSYFVGETPWAHLDIAPTANTDRPGPYQPRGATGVGVRLVLELLRHWKELRIV
jgi:leucyl aminopeptidase